MDNIYINIQTVAKARCLKSTRALRISINQGKYIAREISVQGGKSYEILLSSLEMDIQEKIIEEFVVNENQSDVSNALIPLASPDLKSNFISESARLTALARIDLINAWARYRNKHKSKNDGDTEFLELYNSGEYLKQVFKLIGKTSKGSLFRWQKAYEECSCADSLLPQYRYASVGEFRTSLPPEAIKIFLNFLLHPNRLNIGKAIKFSIHLLERQGLENIPKPITFRRYAEHFKKNNYDKWVLMREGEKALKDKVEHFIKRDISKIEVGDVLVADGHRLNFQVINPFTGKPTRATLVGFLDWKSGALIGYEIMLEENTHCIASALRMAILNLGTIPKFVYQDNGRAFRAKYFQSTNFDEAGFNGVYQNLGITPVFAKPYNARAKVIERFFLEFQEEFEKLMPSYSGTSISEKPAWLMRNEKFHKELHRKNGNDFIPTIQEAIKLIDTWLEFYNSRPWPFFSSNYEKYEWLMKHGCTNSDDRAWISKYIKSEEYVDLYGNTD